MLTKVLPIPLIALELHFSNILRIFAFHSHAIFDLSRQFKLSDILTPVKTLQDLSQQEWF